jgi:hypothetical protein
MLNTKVFLDDKVDDLVVRSVGRDEWNTLSCIELNDVMYRKHFVTQEAKVLPEELQPPPGALDHFMQEYESDDEAQMFDELDVPAAMEDVMFHNPQDEEWLIDEEGSECCPELDSEDEGDVTFHGEVGDHGLKTYVNEDGKWVGRSITDQKIKDKIPERKGCRIQRVLLHNGVERWQAWYPKPGGEETVSFSKSGEHSLALCVKWLDELHREWLHAVLCPK